MELSKTTLSTLQSFYGRKTLARNDYHHAVDIASSIKRDSKFLDRFGENFREYLSRCQALKISPLSRQRYTTLAKTLYRDNTGMRDELIAYWSEVLIR